MCAHPEQTGSNNSSALRIISPRDLYCHWLKKPDKAYYSNDRSRQSINKLCREYGRWLQNPADQAIDADTTQAADKLAHFYRILRDALQLLVVSNDLSMGADALQLLLTL